MNKKWILVYEANIQVVTTKSLKELKYAKNNAVLFFEDLIKICLENTDKWTTYVFEEQQLMQAITLSQKQIERHQNHQFVKDMFTKRMLAYKNRIETLQ